MANPSQVLGPIRRVQLGESVANEIRRAILLGRLRTGERLIEAEIAERMRVSRGPVREALRQLELESLVEVQPNGHTLVVGLSREGIAQLYDARLCLEHHALELAVPNVTATDLRRMQGVLDGMTAAADEHRDADMVALDMAFHRSFFVLAQNRILAQLWETLNPQIQGLLEITDVINPRIRSISEKHQQILDALGQRDATAAQAALASHLAEAQQVLLDHLGQKRLLGADGPAARGAHPALDQEGR